MDDINFSSATQLAAAIQAGHISASEVLEAHLAQIAAYNPALNAIVTLDAAGARERARAADAALARGEVWGPLHGVPFTLKDAHATAGMRTTTGFPPLDHIPTADGAVAARLKAAGGILMGKTNVPPMLADFQTDNPIFGRTNNPWNTERTPGGSSGGAAAAVAAGLTPFDIGTDLSNSIRLPAHFCGVYGFKPTERRVPLTGLIPGFEAPRSVRIMSCIGPIARSVDDLALLDSLIAGPDGQDTEVAPLPDDTTPPIELKSLRIAFAPTLPGLPVAAEVRAAVEQLATSLQPLCAPVAEAPLPARDVIQDLRAAGTLIAMITGAFDPTAPQPPVTLAQYLAALDERDRAIAAWERFFDNWDALLCPPSMLTAFAHCQPGSPLRLDGEEVPYFMVSAHGTLFDYTGHPAAVLPFRHDHLGLPIGVQLAGRRWHDARLLATARALTAVTGTFQRPPGY